MNKFSRKEIDAIVSKIQELAIAAEILPEDVRLYFQPGSVTNGISPEVVAITTAELGGRMHFRTYFIPEFTYKDSRHVVGRTLSATLAVLKAVTDN